MRLSALTVFLHLCVLRTSTKCDHEGLTVCGGGHALTYKATLDMGGVTGDITFQEPTASTSVNIALTGLTGTWGMQIRTFPVAYDTAAPCSNLGESYHDISAAINPTTTVTSDLSGKTLSHRSVLLTDTSDNTNVRCATILPEAVTMKTAIAKFGGPVSGVVMFRQQSDDPSATTIIISNLFYSQNTGSAADTSNNWEVRSSAPSSSGDLATRCASTGSVVTDLGQTMIGATSGSGRKFDTKSGLALSGGSTIVGKSLILKDSSNTVLACAEIYHLEAVSVSARFDMSGVKGTMVFSQNSPYESTTVTININNIGANAINYHVHEYPIPAKAADESMCSGTYTAGHLNPFGKVPSSDSYPDPAVGTGDQYELGDLSGKFGNFNGMDTVSTVNTDWYLPLYGRYSIVGRSVIIHDTTGSRWVCANIGYPGEVITAMAVFKTPIAGHMVLRQVKDKPYLDTSVFLTVSYIDGTAGTSDHSWHVHEDSLGLDYAAVENRCSSTAGHFNPYAVDLSGNYASQCNGNNPLRCELGDLSGKHGKVDVGSEDSISRNFYTDVELPLSGPEAVIGRSMVIHQANSGGGRLACANIFQLPAVEVSTQTWHAQGGVSISGTFSVTQASPFDSTTTVIDVTGLSNNADTYHVHKLPVPFGEDNPCSAASVAGHYNPFNVVIANSPASGSGTSDQYEIGDLSGKYGSMQGQTGFSETNEDGNLPLFGTYSSIGRSIVIHDNSGGRWHCANLTRVLPVDASTVSAMAEFEAISPAGDNTITGKIVLTQVIYADGSGGDTTLQVDIRYAKDASKQTSDHSWHIHEQPVTGDENAVTSRCSSCRGHFNPYNADLGGNYATRCKPGNPLRCELGDLSGKQGKYAVGGGQRVYTDVDIPLYGELTVVGRSIVIHEANGGGGRLGCGTIRPMTQTATIAFPPIDNFDSTDFRTTVANLLEIAVWKVAIFYVPKTNSIRECQEVTFYVLGNIERSKVEALVSGSQASELGKYAPGDSCKSYVGTPQAVYSSATTWSKTSVLFTTLLLGTMGWLLS
ncbi:uncharacterized protein LOC144869220 isoform X1 [Branchiostoma floridae x Branchiostoma japonicum]